MEYLKVETFDDKLIPKRCYPADGAVDLLCSEDHVEINHLEWKLINTGIKIEIPFGYVGLICPKSGLGSKGISIINAPGIVDSGYTGEILVNIINYGKNPYIFNKYDKIAQLVIQNICLPEFKKETIFKNTKRGNKGHGSTGK